MRKIIVAIMMAFALLVPTAAVSSAQPAAAVSTPAGVELKPIEDKGFQEPNALFARTMKNSSLSNYKSFMTTKTGGNGDLIVVQPGRTSSVRVASVLFPAGCWGFVDGFPAYGGKFGNWVNVKGLTRITGTVRIWC